MSGRCRSPRPVTDVTVTDAFHTLPSSPSSLPFFLMFFGYISYKLRFPLGDRGLACNGSAPIPLRIRYLRYATLGARPNQARNTPSGDRCDRDSSSPNTRRTWRPKLTLLTARWPLASHQS